MIKILNDEGYQNHKEALETYSNMPDNITVVRPTNERLRAIEVAILEYRRQHNIFEVGDRVVILTMHLDNKFVHVVSKVLEDLVEVCGSYVYSSELRHATPEEIATGKKLEVS